MKFPLRTILLIVWAMAVVFAGVMVGNASGNSDYGWATSYALVAISLGVPLMRALTEHSS